MFIGHYAVGLAAKRAAPRASLTALVAAAAWADILFTFLHLAGIEKAGVDLASGKFMPIVLIDLPWSHSLLMSVLWAMLLAGGYYAVRRYQAGAEWIALGVLSHWALDWLTHRPDMMLVPGGARYGLGLWDHPAATAVVEGGFFALAAWLYAGAAPAKDAAGRWGYRLFVAALAALYVSTFFSPPPPSEGAMRVANVVLLLVSLAWCMFLDRHRG